MENLYFAPLIAKFLNSLFGVHALGHKLTDEQMQSATTIVAAQREEDKLRRQEANVAIAAAAAAQQAQVDGTVAPEATEVAAPAEIKSTRDLDIRLADGSRVPVDPLSPANLWQLVRVTVSEKFGYQLPAYLPITARSKVCMLRSFCLKTGVQLLCKDYDLAPNSKVRAHITLSLASLAHSFSFSLSLSLSLLACVWTSFPV